jgi:hypothetical protein
MFIRTQDRQELISDSAFKSIKVDNNGNILGVPFTKNFNYVLGDYKDNVRSMKVLNEIQRAMQSDYGNILSDSKIKNYSSGVYIMPKE